MGACGGGAGRGAWLLLALAVCAGAVVPEVSVGEVPGRPYHISVGDLNGDLVPEVLVAGLLPTDEDSELTESLQVFSLDVEGAWSESIMWDGRGLATEVLASAVGDLDGDLDNDVATLRRTGDIVFLNIRLNDGASYIDWPSFNVPIDCPSEVLSEFDFVTRGSEILLSCHVLRPPAVFLVTVDVTSATVLRIPTGDYVMHNVAFGDFDGDGTNDIVAASREQDAIVWFERPSWAPHVIHENVWDFTRLYYGISVGDVDGDGDDDVVSIIRGSSSGAVGESIVEWHENLQTEWAAHLISSTTVSDAVSLALGDLDGDTRLDVVVSSKDDSRLCAYFNDAVAGTATTGGEWPSVLLEDGEREAGEGGPFGKPWGVEVADFGAAFGGVGIVLSGFGNSNVKYYAAPRRATRPPTTTTPTYMPTTAIPTTAVPSSVPTITMAPTMENSVATETDLRNLLSLEGSMEVELLGRIELQRPIEVTSALALMGGLLAPAEAALEDVLLSVASLLLLVDVEIVGDARQEKGCVRVGPGGSLRASGTTFRDCATEESGGALLLQGSSAVFLQDSFFIGCVAKRDGAAIYHEQGAASLKVVGCAFADCEAWKNGGAIASKADSLSVENSTFDRTTAASHGNAIVMQGKEELTSTFDLVGSTFRSCATEGASGKIGKTVVFASVNSALVKGCLFEFNYVPVAGQFDKEVAVLQFAHSTRTSVLDTNFTGNLASSIRAYQLYTGTFEVRRCVFAGNGKPYASENPEDDLGGAAIAIKESLVETVITDSVFMNNSAWRGGAMHISQAHTRIERCVFEGNFATTEGGAIYVDSGAVDVKIAESRFEANVARHAGGAISALATTQEFIFSGSIQLSGVYGIANVALGENEEGIEDGRSGGFARLNGARLFAVRGLTLQGNTGGALGGRLPSGLTLRFVTAKLFNYSSPTNDNIYLMGSGVTDFFCSDEKLGIINYTDSPDWQKLRLEEEAGQRECSLCEAGSEWDAADLECRPCAAGSSKDLGSSECRACGAGTIAPTEGEAKCSNCPSLDYAPLAGGQSCDFCGATAGDGFCATFGDAECSCCDGFYFSGSRCLPCDDISGAQCDGLGSTLEGLELEAGFYRTKPSSKETYRCPSRRRGCIGGNRTGAALCAEGYVGVLCSTCAKRYYMAGGLGSGGLKCKECLSVHLAASIGTYCIFFLAIGVLVAFFAPHTAFIASSLTGSGHDLADASLVDLADSVWSKKKRAAGDEEKKDQYHMFSSCMAYFKAIISFVQIITSLPEVFGGIHVKFVLPSAYNAFLNVLGVVNLSVPDWVPARCLAGGTSSTVFYTRGLLVTTLFLPLVALVLGAVHLARRGPHTTDVEALRQRRARRDASLTAFILLVYLFTPICSLVSIQALVCDWYDKKGGFLRVSLEVSCSSRLYTRFIKPYGALCCIVYPAGIPIAYMTHLWRHRRDLNPTDKLCPLKTYGVSSSPESTEQEATPVVSTRMRTDLEASLAHQLRLDAYRTEHSVALGIEYFSFLWSEYEPRVYYWEVVEVVKRIFFTALLIIVDPGSRIQIVTGLAVGIVYMASLLKCSPFLRDATDHIALANSWAIIIILFVYLMIRGRISFHRDGNSSLVIALLFFATCLPITVFANILSGVLKPKRCTSGRKTLSEEEPLDDGDDDAPEYVDVRAEEEEQEAGEICRKHEDNPGEAPSASANGRTLNAASEDEPLVDAP